MSNVFSAEAVNPAALEVLDRFVDDNRELFERLRSLLRYLSVFPESQTLPANEQSVQEAFEAYPTKEQIEEERWQRLVHEPKQTTEKTDFMDKNDPNLGWKFHLNVAPLGM